MNLTVRRDKGQLVTRPYKSHSIQYLDQLSDTEVWICSGVFNRYLMNNYGITSKEYYNLVIYGDKGYCPPCSNPNCKNKRSFISLSRGYHKTCGKSECISIMSSIHCTNQHLDKNSSLNKSLNKLHKSENFLRIAGKRMRNINNKNWKNQEYREHMKEKSYETINSWKSKCKNKYKAFLRLGRLDDICIFYVGLTASNDIKFGVTGVNLDKGRCNRQWRLKLKSIHRLKISDRKTVAEIEMNLKFYLGSDSEYIEFSKLREVINFVRNYK